MFPILNIGPLALQTSGLLILAGIWLGITISEKSLPKITRLISASNLYNLVFLSLLAGLIGGLFIFVLLHPEAFRGNWISAFIPNTQMFDVSGGLIIALIAALVYSQQKHLPFWATLDSLTPMLAVISIFIGLANLASGNAYGTPTNLPWGIELWGATRHPTQIYHILSAMVILWLIIPGKTIHPYPSGIRFLIFLSCTSFILLLIDTFHGEGALILDRFRQVQLFALVILGISVHQIFKRKNAVSGEAQNAST